MTKRSGIALEAHEVMEEDPLVRALLDAAADERGDAYIEGVGGRICFNDAWNVKPNGPNVLYQIAPLSNGWVQYFVQRGYTQQEVA